MQRVVLCEMILYTHLNLTRFCHPINDTAKIIRATYGGQPRQIKPEADVEIIKLFRDAL
jgi:hypothetical protein